MAGLEGLLASQPGGPPGLSLPLLLAHSHEQRHQVEDAVVRALSGILDMKDISTGTHSTRLAEWAARVADRLGMDQAEQRDVEVACLLHDIGKVGIPDAILKKPGRLTPEERAIVNRHPEYSWGIFRLFPHLNRAGLFALHHHEKFDGSGYPAGLRGTDIPQGARLVAIVDVFDALISKRAYKPGLPLAEVLAHLRKGAGTHFDPEIVEMFIELAEEQHAEVLEIVSDEAYSDLGDSWPWQERDPIL
jgi:HD-GYP domain-containing protein (c-di-GMP phosphodiesterase class II)